MVFAAAVVFAAGARAQNSVEEARDEAESELDAALAALAETRDEIAGEKPPLAREFEAVEQELRRKRRLARIARMSREDREAEIRQLKSDRATRRQDANYLAGLLKDHALRIQTLSGPGEPELEVDPKIIAAEIDDPAAAVGERLAVLDASLDRLEALLGGSTGDGEVATPDGEVISGRLATAGPMAWFADGHTAGAIVWERGGSLPKLIPGESEAVRALLDGREATVGIDVTGGKARALDEIDGGALGLIRKGGLWIWPIILMALLSLVFGIIKLVGFARYREPGQAWVEAVAAAVRSGDRAKADALAAEARHPVGDVMRKLVDRASQAADVVEETLYEQLMSVQQKAGSLLPVIAVTAATAPLLGLLGTVSGMIRTFNLITLFGSGDPKPLAGGISEALITTLFGLVVAIPALILHAFLARRSQGVVQGTERLGLSFVNSLRDESPRRTEPS
jgi:biopolymer transport protein ExbB